MGGKHKPRRDTRHEVSIAHVEHEGMDYELTACGKIYAVTLSRMWDAGPVSYFPARRLLNRDGPTRRAVAELFEARDTIVAEIFSARLKQPN